MASSFGLTLLLVGIKSEIDMHISENIPDLPIAFKNVKYVTGIQVGGVTNVIEMILLRVIPKSQPENKVTNILALRTEILTLGYKYT